MREDVAGSLTIKAGTFKARLEDVGANYGLFGYQGSMTLHAADPIGSETGPVSFELDRFKLEGDQGLELRGRWFGVRGRRFVRPTLTLLIDGAKHRALADLEHKPWAAEEGEEWVASFSPMPQAGEASEIVLTVAPDIAIPLPPPGFSAPPAIAKRSTGGAGTPRPAARRNGQSDRPRRTLEQERAKARDLRRTLKDAQAECARLAGERDALVAERDGLRHEQARSRERVAELQDQLRRSEASADAGRSEALDRLEAERAETNRLRTALDLHEALVADRDRLARELDAAVAERNQLAERVSQPRPVEPEHHPAPRDVPARQIRRAYGSRAYGERSAGAEWAVRAIAMIALCSVLITLLLVLHMA